MPTFINAFHDSIFVTRKFLMGTQSSDEGNMLDIKMYTGKGKSYFKKLKKL
jgi:hypothetical protein